jgi:1,4-dihydroxy-2-naphthoate octaprenyltransferase
MKLHALMLVSRAPFLLLAVVLGFLGAALAWYEHQEYGSTFSLGYAFLAGIGLVIAHISVNVFNEYFDFRSKVDFRTPRTPFSGGSGALPSGMIKEKQALWLGIGSLLIIIPIGIFFTVVKGWPLLPLLLVSAVIIIVYTPFILKMGYPEWAPGVGLGILPVLGAYFIQTGEYTITALIAAVPSGILVHNLLLLNELPDAEADKTVKRRTLPIVVGKKNAAIVYSVLMVVMYLWITGAVITGDMPDFTLLALLTLPLAYKAVGGAFKFNDMGKMVPALANNVFVVLLTQLLMGIGFILAGVF